MLEYIGIAISFIVGGGLSTILTMKYVRKTNKLDYTEKAIKFMNEQYDKVLKKNEDLERRVELLEAFVPVACFNYQCELRIKDQAAIRNVMNHANDKK